MDLFEEDKRLFLRPVMALSEHLVEAFADGACTCVRCKESGGDQTAYSTPHTFEVAGRQIKRRFAISSHSDVRGALAKAWQSYYKTDLPETGPADMGAIATLVQGQAARLLEPLLYAVGVITRVKDVPHFSEGSF